VSIGFVILLLASNGLSAAPSGRAFRMSDAPTIDGDVLSDRAWSLLIPLSDFTQQQPNEGEAASQLTEVYIGFTDTALYVGIVCHDSDPESIIVSNSHRDANLNDSDSFRLVIDAFQSQQNGVVFGTNPSGLEYDGQVTADDTNGFGNGFDLNWDTPWQVEAMIGDFGWSAEMEIPFTSLRYGGDAIQQWAFNFQRTMRKRNEVVYWSPIPRQFGLDRLSLAGTVNGIETPPQRNFTVTPYGLGRSVSGGGPLEEATETEFGFDAKYSITPSLTLDVTYNTDFAQVEVDRQQINLNRFSLFFPEKRPFFLENASQFEVGARGIELFFSRRIGLGPDGERIPIVGGLRLSGKVGTGTNLGLLAMRSEAVPGITPQSDFKVVRVKQEMGGRSSLGMLLIDRDDGDTDNQTYAVDGLWGIGEQITISGFVAKTSTPGEQEKEHAINLFSGYNSQNWSFNGSYTEVADGFNPEVGFLARGGFRRVNVFVMRRIRSGSEASSILEYSPHASYTGHWDFDGFYETGFLHLDSSIEWKSGADLHTALNYTHEGVKTAFEISPGVFVEPGDYDDWEFSMFTSTNSSAPFRARLGLTAGGFFGGDRLAVSPSFTYRPNESFEASLGGSYNDIELEGGDFDVGLTNLELSYSFTPKMSISALVQHDDRAEVLSTNLRFAWLQSANAGLYVVYNELDDKINAPGRKRREFILKYSRILRIF